MNKEDILKLSREENQGREGEYEAAAQGKASRVGMAVGGLICMVAVLICDMVFDAPQICLAMWTVYFSMNGSRDLALYRHLRKKRDLVLGIVFLAIAVAMAVAFVWLQVRHG